MAKETETNSTFHPRDRKVCPDCIGDKYLKKIVNRCGGNSSCFYCNNESKTIEIKNLAKFIKRFFEDHFALITQDELAPSQIEVMGELEPNVNFIIQEYAEVDVDIADDLHSVLKAMTIEDGSVHSRTEGPFSDLAHYKKREIQSHHWDSLWRELKRTILEENRMFNRKAKEILDQIFANTIKIRNHQDGKMPAIVEIGPNMSRSTIFRAREFQSYKKLRAALKRPDLKLGPPPPSIAPANRMNAKGVSMFYGAVESEVAIAEIRPAIGSKVIVAEFDVIRSLKLLDIVRLQSTITVGSMFRPSMRTELEKRKFISDICKKISAPVMPIDESVDYLITQAIADYLSALTDPIPIDGIIYQSAQKADESVNVVLFNKSSRVKLQDIPKKVKVYKSHEDSSDQNSEIEYSIHEVLSEEDNEEIHHASDNGRDENGDKDKRVPSLGLDISNVSVYVIDGANFEFHPREIRRHRIDEQKIDF